MGRFEALTFLNVGERAQPYQEISFTASETVSYNMCARVHRKGRCHWAMLSCQKDQALLGLWVLTMIIFLWMLISLLITLLKLMSIESVMPSNHLILCPFSSCPQSFPASGSFQMSQLFASGGQSIGVSALTSDPPMNSQDWSPLGWTGWISLQSKRLSRVFSNTTVQKHQFFCAQPSSQSKSHIHTWPLEKP